MGLEVDRHYRDEDDDSKYASKGLAGTALGIAIGGLVAALSNGGLGNIFGGLNGNNCNNNCNNNGAAAATVLQMFETKEASCLRQENAALKAEKYADSIGISTYKEMVAYVNNQNELLRGNLKDVTSEVIQQGKDVAVLKSNIQCLDQKLDYEIRATREESRAAIAMESERRKCGDENLYSYVNATFVPGKLVMPKESICPEVMPRYNCFKAPTCDTTPAPTA